MKESPGLTDAKYNKYTSIMNSICCCDFVMVVPCLRLGVKYPWSFLEVPKVNRKSIEVIQTCAIMMAYNMDELIAKLDLS